MRNIRTLAMLTTLLAIASTAGAQSGSTSDATQGGTTAGGTLTTSTSASTATSDERSQVEAIQKRAASLSKKAVETSEARLRQIAGKVDATAQQGEDRVAGRLATEFNTTAQAMTDEKAQFNCGWGELMIAHTLAANSSTSTSLATLFQMRTDGMGWGQIAGGMGFRLGDAVSAARAEARVAEGQAKADGRVAAMYGSGSKHGMSASAVTGASANAHAAHVNAGAGMNVSSSVHVGH